MVALLSAASISQYDVLTIKEILLPLSIHLTLNGQL